MSDNTSHRKHGSGRGRTGKPNPIDVHVGSRVRLRRTLLGLSQEKLADAIGLTFQQVQKYERGANRIGASRLYELSKVLDVPVSFFFDDMAADLTGRRAAHAGLSESGQAPFETDALAKRETLELVRAYYRITDPHVRKKVADLVKTMAASTEDKPERGSSHRGGSPRRR